MQERSLFQQQLRRGFAWYQWRKQQQSSSVIKSGIIKARVIGMQEQKRQERFCACGGSFNVGSMEGEKRPWFEFPYHEKKSWLAKTVEGTDSGQLPASTPLGILSPVTQKEEGRLSGALHPTTLCLAGQGDFKLSHHSGSPTFTDNHSQLTTNNSVNYLSSGPKEFSPGQWARLMKLVI